MSYRRKYKVGDRINSLDELVKETYVYAFGTCARGIRHISVIESMSLRTVKSFLHRGIYKAVPVETAPIIEVEVKLDDNEEDKAEKEDKELHVEKIRKLQTYKLAPELENLVSLEKVNAILEGEE